MICYVMKLLLGITHMVLYEWIIWCGVLEQRNTRRICYIKSSLWCYDKSATWIGFWDISAYMDHNAAIKKNAFQIVMKASFEVFPELENSWQEGFHVIHKIVCQEKK